MMMQASHLAHAYRENHSKKPPVWKADGFLLFKLFFNYIIPIAIGNPIDTAGMYVTIIRPIKINA